MRTLAHISDVHFGREDPVLVKGLLEALAKAAPDIVAVSGDLTQRARTGQFKKARKFLDALPVVPRIVVPGNHDVSATNLVERFTQPLAKYKRYITRDMEPYFEDAEVAIAGINTVRLLARKDGRINRKQVVLACERLSEAAGGQVRIVVTHHPMDLPLDDTRNALVGRSKKAMAAFAACRVDLFLSGHLHAGVTVATNARYAGYNAVVVHAGTAVSTRTRGEANSWNLLRVGAEEIVVEQQVWDAERGAFALGLEERFYRGPAGWGRAG